MLAGNEGGDSIAGFTELEVLRLLRRDPREAIGSDIEGSLHLCRLWEWYRRAPWARRSIYLRDVTKFILIIATEASDIFNSLQVEFAITLIRCMCGPPRTLLEEGQRLHNEGHYSKGRGMYEMKREVLLMRREKVREAIMSTTDVQRLIKVVKGSIECAIGYPMAIRAITRMISLNLTSLLGDETVTQIVIEHQGLLAGLSSLSRAALLDHYPDALNYIVYRAVGAWCVDSMTSLNAGDHHQGEMHVLGIKDRLFLIPWTHLREPGITLDRLRVFLLTELVPSLPPSLAEELDHQFSSISTLFPSLNGR